MEFLFWMEVKRNVGMEGEGERLRKRNVENGFLPERKWQYLN